MNVEYSKSFVKVVSKLSGKQLQSVRDVIAEVKNAEVLDDITDCKRLVLSVITTCTESVSAVIAPFLHFI